MLMRVTRYECPKNITVTKYKALTYSQYHFKDKDVVTVWSAPNYCYRCGNVASIMNLGEDLKQEFQIFSAVPDHRRAVPAGRGGRGEYFL